MMNPNKKTEVMQFTTAAKSIIFNSQRLQTLIPMMGTPEGAIQAVQAVMGAIEQRKPIPPEVAPLVGINVYMLLVDMAHEITGDAPDQEIVVSVIQQIARAVQGAGMQQAQRPASQEMSLAAPGQVASAGPVPAPATGPGGLVARAMGG